MSVEQSLTECSISEVERAKSGVVVLASLITTALDDAKLVRLIVLVSVIMLWFFFCRQHLSFDTIIFSAVLIVSTI